jgi:AbrB family looped-hinge helix DNA binding protein
MGAQTKLSAKGQVVIPKPIRDRLRWQEGASLEVVETANGVLLRPAAGTRERITVEEFRRRHSPPPGPSLSLEEIDACIAREAARRFGPAQPPE